MKNNSRTKNAMRNVSVTVLCHIVYLICSFVCRTVFTKQLGAEYLGIGGLFTNILTILSFAELGLGSTLVYHLYKPLADNDENKVSLYIELYKKIYSVIIIIILVIGLLVCPFLKYLVKAPNVKESLILLYLLYLTQTITSYLFVYKKSILTADQKDYIVSLFTEISNLVMNILQCIILIFFKNFVMYCIISIITGIVNNIMCSIYVEKKYPYLKNKTNGSLDKKEIDSLKTDAKGLLMTKVASTAFTGTDNIFISSFIGIKYVGILSNYTLIVTVINSLMNKVFSSVTASIGNLAVSDKSSAKTEDVLLKMFFVNTAFYSYMCIGLVLLIGDFVTKIWIGSEYYLSQTIITLVILELYIRSIHYPLYTTRNALGLFSQYKIVFVIAACLNIILDFILVKPFGIAGLVIATILCRGSIYIVDIFVIYKFGFKQSCWNYVKRLLKWFVFTAICYVLSRIAINWIITTNIAYFVLKCMIVTITYTILFFLFFSKNDETKFIIDLFRKIGFKVLKRKKRVI